MSQLQVTTLEANTLSAPAITAGQTTVNSSGLYLSGTTGVINASAIVVSNASSNVVLQGITNLASITIGGTVYTSLITETVNTQIFTANNTWTKPGWANTGNELVVVHMWGGGGGGETTGGRGGGGGAFVFGYYKANTLSSTANVVVGLGGGSLTNGGNSIFANGATNALVAYGGVAGPGSGGTGGGGGGWLGVGTTATGGAPLGGTAGLDSTFGGGGGGSGVTTGSSVYGGGGGGSGGAAGSTPGGGGSATTSASNTGARGEVRVWVFGPASLT